MVSLPLCFTRVCAVTTFSVTIKGVLLPFGVLLHGLNFFHFLLSSPVYFYIFFFLSCDSFFHRFFSPHVLLRCPSAFRSRRPGLKGLSKDQVSVHYEKHHKGYATKLNAAAESNPDLKSKSLLEVIKTTSGPVFNSAAQIFNHDFFWKSLSPDQGGKPSGAILKAIEESFGTFEKFKEEFTAAAVGHFGSGWVWLVKDTSSNKLKVLQTHDAANPLTEANLKPILTCDLWEHAYYIDYKNDRAAFINTFWNLVNWKFAESQL
eukprot:gene13246-9090_t